MNPAAPVFHLFSSGNPDFIIYVAELRADEFGMTFRLQCSKHLRYGFHIQYIFTFTPSWCGRITYQKWLKYVGWISTSTTIEISISWARSMTWISDENQVNFNFKFCSEFGLGGMFLTPWETTKELYSRQLYNMESFCSMYPCRRCAAIDNGPPPTIHDPSNDTFHLVKVDKFLGPEVFIIFDPIGSGVD